MLSRLIKLMLSPLKLLTDIVYGPRAIVGHSWYTPKEYAKLYKMASDPGMIPTYELWQEQAESTIRQFEETGNLVLRVEIDVDDLAAWLRDEGLDNTEPNREAYVLEILRQTLDDGIRISNKRLHTDARNSRR